MDGWSVLKRLSLSSRRRKLSVIGTTPAAADTSSDSVGGGGSTTVDEAVVVPEVPETQNVLLLLGPRQPYQLTADYPVPKLEGDSEVLVKTCAIGLNPIDWKAPDFNFAIPVLPYISGRELSGEVCQVANSSSRLSPGDRVILISTDYRDLRKAAYQEYVAGFDFNTVKLPPSLSFEDGATLGVAFVAAVLSLGICMGVNFSNVLDGPDLLSIVKGVHPNTLPEDVREECLNGIPEQDRATSGDWLAIWGGSATSANLTIQLARLAGLKVAAVVDSAKHGLRLSNHKVIRPDLLIDSHDPQRAVDILKANVCKTRGLRFGVDTRGKDTAALLLQALCPNTKSANGSPPSPPSTPRESTALTRNAAHLIGLTGLPKGSPPDGAAFHTVPIKLFHEVPAVGHALVTWLERLLAQGLVSPPEIIDIENGLENVNTGLDRMRSGEISGGKLIVRLEN